jgi:hypothetical protein
VEEFCGNWPGVSFELVDSIVLIAVARTSAGDCNCSRRLKCETPDGILELKSKLWEEGEVHVD